MADTKYIIVRRFLAVLVSLSLVYAAYILVITGELRTLEPHFDGRCRTVPGVPGAEDIAMLADGTAAIISSQDRHADLAGAAPRGALFLYSLTATSSQPVNLTPHAPADFRPHGIGLYEGAESYLFVVNHPRANVEGDLPGHGPAHTIELYALAGTSLQHLRTISDPESLITPNDVAAIGPDTFYVTNDHGSGDPLVRKIEEYLRLARSHILFYDGNEFQRVPGTYRYANGIAASPDGRQVFMSAPADRTVYVFDRDSSSNMLHETAEIFLGSGGDNINLDASGNLWIGAHPKILSFARYVHNPDKPSPSQVLRVSQGDDGAWHVHEAMLTDGSDRLASSTAAHHGNRLLVGGVFGEGFLDCTMADTESTQPIH